MAAALQYFKTRILNLIAKPLQENQDTQNLQNIYKRAFATLEETLKKDEREIEKNLYLFELSTNQINLTEAYLNCMKNRLVDFNELVKYSIVFNKSYKRLQKLTRG